MLQKVKVSKPDYATKGHQTDQSLKKVAAKGDAVLKAIRSQPRYNCFKNAAQLGLTSEQRNSLIKTLKLMESGKITHIKTTRLCVKGWATLRKNKNGLLFNMSDWRADYDCGTVACIGGTAELIAGAHIFEGAFSLPSRNQLYKLFFGNLGVQQSTTDVEAARALRGYLETGKTNWQKARGRA